MSMRILHINNYFANRFFYENLYNRQERDNTIKVIIPVQRSHSIEHDYPAYVSVIKKFGFLDKVFFLPRIRKAAGAIGWLIDKEPNYDIIHAHSLYTNGSIARVIAKTRNIPYIVTVRNVDVNTVFKKYFFLRKYGRKLLLSSGRVVFLSEAVLKETIACYCQELPLEKCVVIPNGVDDFWIKNKGKSKAYNTSELKILYVGEINKNKNIVFVAKTLNKLIQERKNTKITFRVVGEIKDWKVYKDLLRFSFVKITEFVSKEVLIGFYRNSDVFIMASLKESFGITYVEAMSQGLPVIYTKGQGFDGQFKEGVVGYHVNPFSEEELKDCILKIIENYDAISKNCINLCDRFDWDTITNLFYETYRCCISEMYAG